MVYHVGCLRKKAVGREMENAEQGNGECRMQNGEWRMPSRGMENAECRYEINSGSIFKPPSGDYAIMDTREAYRMFESKGAEP